MQMSSAIANEIEAEINMAAETSSMTLVWSLTVNFRQTSSFCNCDMTSACLAWLCSM